MREIYQAKSFFKTSIMKMLLKAEETFKKRIFEKKVSKKMNHEFKQFNFT